MAETEAATDAKVHSSEGGDRDAEEQTETSAISSAARQERDANMKDATNDEPSDVDEYALTLSAAQLRVKVEQARLETKIALDAEILALRKQVIELEHQVRELQRNEKQAADKHQRLQSTMDAIMKDHKRTLNGMRDDLQLETLVASLETEKAAREKLHLAYEKQNAALLAAQARVESLTAQVQKYQTTETVLAQSISHFQHRFDSKDQARVASLERVKQDLEEKHRADTAALRQEVEIAKRAEQMAQEQLQRLEKERRGLQESVSAVMKLQGKNEALEKELRVKISHLETDKAVLVRKAEQLQKADAQLRSKANAQEDELQELRDQNFMLQEENKELTKIASDLMEMAEKHQEEKRRQNLQRDEDTEFLATRKKRLRMSIG
uniref:Uncharacterized protein n=1 Tax=Globisporangium ultimum (strain ATCC 200006 / CBS 805.95 / DAOM BR144) TaxID=431595 RepID=K3XB35_GLOUD